MKKNLTYMDSVHRDGRIWNISVMILLMLFPVAVGHTGLGLPCQRPDCNRTYVLGGRHY